MKSQPKAKVTKVDQENKTVTLTEIPTSLECTVAYLHAAIMIDGKTESTLTKGKIPSIKSMEWTPNFTALIVKARTTHCLPAAAVKDSIVLL